MIRKKNKQIECPICKKYSFEIKYENTQKNTDYCPFCGWKYDQYQLDHSNIANLTNRLSVNDYKKWYRRKLKENPKYDYTEENYVAKPHDCPVCGKYKFKDESSFDICPYCGWEDDQLMEDEPDKWAGCANPLCLNDYRKEYKKLIMLNPNYKWKNQF